MARGFTGQEKEMIRAALMDKGTELFSRYGLKKTSVADLTAAAGIAQGSFYLFFSSKEELYFEILEAMEQGIREHFIAEFFTGSPLTRERFKDFIKQALAVLETNPLLKQLFVGGELKTLLRKLPPEKVSKHIQQDEDVLLPLISYWQDEGIMIDGKPEVITGLIRALFAIPLHKDMIGEASYDAVIDLLSACIAAGLIRNGGTDNDH